MSARASCFVRPSSDQRLETGIRIDEGSELVGSYDYSQMAANPEAESRLMISVQPVFPALADLKTRSGDFASIQNHF
jgi:hypothetical protein